MPTTTAILVAAGSSRRMGFDKLFANLGGKPVLTWSLEALEHCPLIDAVIVVTAEEVREAVGYWTAKLSCEKVTGIVPGGAERHLSVAAGLREAANTTDGQPPRLVAVHDGARPLVTPEQIARCVNAADLHGAAAAARPLAETIKRADGEGFVTGSVDRDGLWAMETPQVFHYPLLVRAYEKVLADGMVVTDEVSAVQALGTRAFLVESTRPNPKITFPCDLELAERLLAAPDVRGTKN
jgi:2-C-methyl-D-erythritol 4-phosphate cytidylyltransferase